MDNRQKLFEFVNSNIHGYLELKFRVEMMRSIQNPAVINKIFFECV